MPEFEIRMARSLAEKHAAQQLRYDVFVREMGAQVAPDCHAAGREADHYDAHADHLILLDHAKADNGKIIGVYRLMRAEQAAAAGGFYSQNEYDLAALLHSGERLLELGRSCVHPEYRRGEALAWLFAGLAAYIEAHEVTLCFGTASFPGTDSAALAPALAFLHANHLAPEALRPRAIGPSSHFISEGSTAPLEAGDRRAAVALLPPLLKSYLRLGAWIAKGAYIDTAFNTTDVLVVLKAERIAKSQKQRFARLIPPSSRQIR